MMYVVEGAKWVTAPLIAARFMVVGCEESDEGVTQFPVEYVRDNRPGGVAVRIVHFLFSSRRDAGERQEKKESRGSEKGSSLEGARKEVSKGGVSRKRVISPRRESQRERTRSSGEKVGTLKSGAWR